MFQYIRETETNMAIVSEPPAISESPNWFCSGNKLAAVYVGDSLSRGRTKLVAKLVHSVVVKFRDIWVICSYASPSMGFDDFEAFLNDLERIVIGRGNRRIVLAGDYNSHSRWWDSLSTNRRGEAMESWAAALDLTLQNDGVTQTCVRPQGSSIVDLTWTTADIAGSIINWRVSSIETLSDHMFLLFELGGPALPKIEISKLPRWNL